MVVIAFNGAIRLLETNVIESSKRCSSDIFDSVIRNKEVLLLNKTSNHNCNKLHS